MSESHQLKDHAVACEDCDTALSEMEYLLGVATHAGYAKVMISVEAAEWLLNLARIAVPRQIRPTMPGATA